MILKKHVDEKSIRELSKENATFMWFYLLNEVIPLEKNVALLFAGQGDNRSLRESVLFQNKIYTQNNLKSFANIKEKSFMKDEDEILFSLGTIFRIESVESLNEYVWLINLTLNGDEYQQFQILRKDFQDKLDQT